MGKPRHGDVGGYGHHGRNLNVVMIVGGTAHPMALPVRQTVREIVEEALKKAKKSSPPETWELSHDGSPLDPERRLDEYGFPEGVKLFLAPRAGSPGSAG